MNRINQKFQEMENELRAAHEALETNLRQVQQQLSGREVDLQALKLEQSTTEAELGALKQERDRLQRALHEYEKNFSSLEAKHLTASSLAQEERTQLDILQRQSKDLRKQVQSLEDQIASVSAERDSYAEKVERAEENHAKALETAMQSLVRLCVVAPTVNVHLGGDQDQAVTCRTTLPREKIRSMVQDTILPVFSKLFVQPDEGTSPDGNNLDEWLQGLLGDMQASIEKHLKHVFQ